LDTIYALASARGKAGVAVLRLSGPQAHAAAAAALRAQAAAVMAERLQDAAMPPLPPRGDAAADVPISPVHTAALCPRFFW
jgi:hypothetical protein